MRLFKKKEAPGTPPESDKAKAVKGAMRTATHKPYEHPTEHEQEIEETKQALHEFEEEQGDWSKSR